MRMWIYTHDETGVRFHYGPDLGGDVHILACAPGQAPLAALLAFADHARARLAEAERDDLEAGGEEPCAACGSADHTTPSDWGVCAVCGAAVRGDGSFLSQKPGDGGGVLTCARCLSHRDDLEAGEEEAYAEVGRAFVAAERLRREIERSGLTSAKIEHSKVWAKITRLAYAIIDRGEGRIVAVRDQDGIPSFKVISDAAYQIRQKINPRAGEPAPRVVPETPAAALLTVVGEMVEELADAREFDQPEAAAFNAFRTWIDARGRAEITPRAKEVEPVRSANWDPGGGGVWFYPAAKKGLPEED